MPSIDIDTLLLCIKLPTAEKRLSETSEPRSLYLKAFAGLQGEGLNAGVEVFSHTNKEAAADSDVTISGVSAFASLPLSESLKGFGRVDAVSTDATDLLLIAGVDHMPAKGVHLMPNLVVALPDGLDPNIQGRLTFYYKF